MKKIAVALISLLLSSVSFANDTCAYKVSKYAPGPGDRGIGQYQGATAEGYLEYEVRVLNNGGTSAYLITVKPSCAFVSQRLVWAD